MFGKRMGAGALVLVFAVGCGDSPAEPPEPGPTEGLAPALTAAGAPTTQTCTKTWDGGTGGSWMDSTRWDPEGVPGLVDHVCITAPGDYEVSAPGFEIASLTLGSPGSDVLLEVTAPYRGRLITHEHITILRDAELSLLSMGSAHLETPEIVNDGVIDVDDACACGNPVATLGAHSATQTGRLEVVAPTTVSHASYVLQGDRAAIVTEGSGGIALPSTTIQMDGGLITGTTQLQPLNFVWNAGRIDEIAPGTSAVNVEGGVITLDATDDDRSGVIEGTAWTLGSVELRLGVVGADERVEVSLPFLRPAQIGSLDGSPVLIEGELSLTPKGGNVVTLEPGGILNRGMLTLQGTGNVRFEGVGSGTEDIVNQGLLVAGAVDVDYAVTGGTIRNEATISSNPRTELLMRDLTTFEAVSGSSSNMRLDLDEGTLQGVGSVGNVESRSGAIIPGAPYGILRTGDLTMDSTSQFIVQVGDTARGRYGVLKSSGDVTLDGLLVIAPAPGTDLGHCGDVVTPLVHDNGARTGAFVAQLGGKTTTTGWRVHMGTDALMLAGVPGRKNGSPPLALNAARVSVAEGGGPAQAQVCLTGSDLTRRLTLLPSSEMGQVQVDNALVFTPLDWMLPRTLTVDPIDDGLVEAARHADSVRFQFAFDPNQPPEYQGEAPVGLGVTVQDNDGNADLQIEAIHASVTGTVGGTVEVEFRITNNGPTESTGATFDLSSTGTAGLTLVSAFQMICTDHSAGRILCDVGGLDSGGSTVVAMTLEAQSAGNTTLDVSLDGRQPDANASNDSATVQVTVN